MPVVKLKKKFEPKICFGLVLTNLEINLYNAIKPKKLADEILKESLNIKPNRFIKVVDAVSSDGLVSILVIYDYLFEKNQETKLKTFDVEVKDFNFNILNISREENLDIEKMILHLSKW